MERRNGGRGRDTRDRGVPPALMACGFCGFEHNPLLRCEQAIRLRGVDVSRETSISGASNIDSASNDTASNKKQRWGREKYNAYQRGLMRRRRAAAKAG